MRSFIYKRKCIFVFLLIAVFSLASACSSPIVLIDDYSDYVNNLFIYKMDEISSGDSGEADPELPNIEETPEFIPEFADEIAGLTRISNFKFSSGTAYFGDYAIVKLNGVTYLMDNLGELTERKPTQSTSPDIILDDFSLKYDKIIAKIDEKYGVLALDGSLLLDFIYDSVLIHDKLIVGKIGNATRIFYDGQYICDASKNAVPLSSTLYSDGGFIYELPENNRAMIGEYYIADSPSDDVVVIYNDEGKFGYANYLTKEVLVEPSYLIANPMRNNVGVVYDYADTVTFPKLISSTGDILYDFSSSLDFAGFEIEPQQINVFECNFGYNLFAIPDLFLTGYVKITEFSAQMELLSFDFIPFSNYVYNDFIISQYPFDFYSISNEQFMLTQYLEIIPIDKSYFIVKDLTGKYALLDENLNTLVENCDRITNYKDTILIENDNKFSYYRL